MQISGELCRCEFSLSCKAGARFGCLAPQVFAHKAYELTYPSISSGLTASEYQKGSGGLECSYSKELGTRCFFTHSCSAENMKIKGSIVSIALFLL